MQNAVFLLAAFAALGGASPALAAGDEAAPASPAAAIAAPPRPRFRLDFGGGLDRYGDNGSQPAERHTEEAAFAQLGYRVAEDLAVASGVEYFYYFGRTNLRLNAETYWHARGGLDLNARLAVTAAEASRQFLPRWELGGGAEIHLAGPVTLLAQYKHRNYAANQGVDVEVVQPGVRIEIGRFAGEAQAVVALVRPGIGDDSVLASAIARLGWTFSDSVSGWIGASSGKEAQLSPGGLLTTPAVRAVFAGARSALGESWALRLDFIFEAREGAAAVPGYLKAGVSLGTTYKF